MAVSPLRVVAGRGHRRPVRGLRLAALEDGAPVTAAANAELAVLASQAATRAPAGSMDRRAWGCAAVALSTTKTTAGAKRALAEWDGPGDVVARAAELITEIERNGTR
jgi:hypothetical protein